MLVGFLFTVIPAGVASAEAPITAAAFAPGGESIVVGSQDGIAIRSWPELKLERKVETRLLHVNDLVFSPAGDRLLAAGGTPREAGEIEWWSWPDGERLKRFDPHEDLVYRAAVAPAGKNWAAASADYAVSLFSREERTRVLRGHSRGVSCAAFLSDELLVTGALDASLRLWEVESGRLVRTLDNHTGEVRDVALRPGQDGPPVIASAAADKTVRLWQPTIGRLMRFARLDAEPLDIAWSPDGALIFAGCSDGRLRAIDPDTVEILHDLPALAGGWAYTIAVHPSGEAVFVGGAGGEMKAVRVSK